MNNLRLFFKIFRYVIDGMLSSAFIMPVAHAQEFNCEVSLNTERLEGNSFDYLDRFDVVIENYINDYQWTEEDFEEEERISCQIQIAFITGTSDFTFSAEVVFQMQRPIYNTASNSTTLLLNDDTWQFQYPEGRNLVHDELQFDALTGFIDFYMYLLLGYDFDTFSDGGGDPYYTQAQNILNLAQSSSAVGWSRATNNRRNRNILISDLNSSSYDTFRSALYEYHRQGLDRFVDSPEEARENILEALKSIQELKRRSSSNFIFDIFFDSKFREIAAAFVGAETDIRLEAYDVLRATDQGHLSEYEKLQN
jgi:hypothetical protein